jgi:hypothetical protein
MAKRDNHYEAAFEAWLRALRLPYVPVNESHRALAGNRTLKSLDYVVSPPGLSGAWLVDVKGRQFPTAGQQYWRNWSTADDLESLAHWETLLGPSARGLLVFAYNVVGEYAPLPLDELFEYRNSLYGFVAIRLDHYASFARPLSARWGTVTVPTPRFRQLARSARDLFGLSGQAAEPPQPQRASRSVGRQNLPATNVLS